MADEPVAILFSGDPSTGECSCDVFRGERIPGGPIREAELLRDSCEGDFPARMWSFTGNDAATELIADFRMRRLLGEPVAAVPGGSTP